MWTLMLKPSGGKNIVLRDQTLATYYPDARTPAAAARVLWHFVGEMRASARLLGVMPVNRNELVLPANFGFDTDVMVLVNPLAADGTPRYSSIDDYDQYQITVNKEKDKHEQDIGDGSTNPFPVTHGLNTEGIQVTFRQNTGNKKEAKADWESDPSDPLNKILVNTGTTPLAADELHIIIQK